ncbi:MAG: DUF2141 domain-containing protein [Parvularculales bacterium]
MMTLTLSPALAKDVTVTVEAIDTERPGQIMAMLFSEDGFPIDHGKALATQTRNVTTGSDTMRFRINVENDTFAIKILHDEDMTGKVSKNWTGIIPSEGLGFSNGAKLGFGPPSYKDAALKTDEVGREIAIPIIYP